MKNIPLIVEKHPENYNGYPFITLIEHNKLVYLTIVNNYTNDMITAYVLDMCNAEGVDEKEIIEIARLWYEESRANFPIAIEFSRRNLTERYAKIIKSFNVEFVSRVIGPLPQYNFTKVKKIRRRRKRTITPALLKTVKR